LSHAASAVAQEVRRSGENQEKIKQETKKIRSNYSFSEQR
jgi:hypothetical protein